MRGGNGSHLPHGLSVVNTYTNVTTGSKWVAVVAKKLIAILITIAKGVTVTQVVATNVVPPLKLTRGTLERPHKIQGSQKTRMLFEQRKDTLLTAGSIWLGGMSEGNQAAAWALLVEYHDIFSLKPGKLGCADLVKHEIRVTDDEPFKERFWRNPPWWMKFINPWRKCWKQVLYALIKACGVTQ